jgi:hypothetical protein
MKKVKAIEIRNRKKVYNLASTAANDDWIRAARLLKAGKMAEFKKMDETPMFIRDERLILQKDKKDRMKGTRNKASS